MWATHGTRTRFLFVSFLFLPAVLGVIFVRFRVTLFLQVNARPHMETHAVEYLACHAIWLPGITCSALTAASPEIILLAFNCRGNAVAQLRI